MYFAFLLINIIVFHKTQHVLSYQYKLIILFTIFPLYPKYSVKTFAGYQ